MQFLTAIDTLGLKSTKLDDWSRQLSCPWCGEEGWSASDYYQCHNTSCEAQVAAPADLLAKFLGGYEQAVQWASTRTKVPLDMDAARRRMRERAVLDMWLTFCSTPPTSEAIHLINRLQSKGFGIKQSAFSAVVLDSRQMRQMVEVAKETGADYPDTWDQNPPTAGRAFCIQTRPHTIDRIVVMNSRGHTSEIVWNRFSAGFCSLIGLSPRKPKLLTATVDTALWLQHELAASGALEEVISVYSDFYGDACPRWNVPIHLMTAVPRHCEPQNNPQFFCPDDVVRLQHVFDNFPGLERTVTGLPADWVANMMPRDRALPWHKLRANLIFSLIPTRVTQMPAPATSILQQTGTRSEDVTRIIGRLRRAKRFQLAEDLEKIALTVVIHRDLKSQVQETANDYRRISGADVTVLANFSLKISANVTFLNQKADRYCQATLRCGEAVQEVLFPHQYLNSQVHTLESDLQRQLAVAGKEAQAGLNPTVIEVNEFRKRVIPWLRKEAAEAKPVHGVDQLGWSDNRKSFTFPGFVVKVDGIRRTSSILCPSVPVLSKFRAMDPALWAESCPAKLDGSGRDLVAMLVASSVRYFRRCVTKPIQIAQSSAAMTLLDKIAEAFGQSEVYSFNQNVRESNRVEGVYGYPLLTAGPRQAAMTDSQIPYIHLTDQGYKLATSPDPEQAMAAGRAAQFCLRKVVEWCLSTGGDAFVEVPSIVHHRSLLREGRWLIENICGQESWDTSSKDATPLELLLAQIPFEEAPRRLTLIDGTELTVDMTGLKWDHDGILRETRDMGSLVAIAEGKIMSTAARLLPAIKAFYGQEPDVTLITN